MSDTSVTVAGLPEVFFAEGDTILEQGKRSHRVFVLKSGEITVESEGEELFRTSTPGTILGEISALLDTVHTADVKAATECELHAISDFTAFLEANPDRAVYVAKTLATRLRHLNRQFVELKHEVLKSDHHKKNPKLAKLIKAIDDFWAQDVF